MLAKLSSMESANPIAVVIIGPSSLDAVPQRVIVDRDPLGYSPLLTSNGEV
jgi:hypothetical protein